MIVDNPFSGDNIRGELVFQMKSRGNRGSSWMTRAGAAIPIFAGRFCIRFILEVCHASAAASGRREKRATGRIGIDLVLTPGSAICPATRTISTHGLLRRSSFVTMTVVSKTPYVAEYQRSFAEIGGVWCALSFTHFRQ